MVNKTELKYYCRICHISKVISIIQAKEMMKKKVSKHKNIKSYLKNRKKFFSSKTAHGCFHNKIKYLKKNIRKKIICL